MGAFSFKRQFVPSILLGLGRSLSALGDEFYELNKTYYDKRQTIRAERMDGRRCRPGEALALYYAQRTKQCRLIGRARCIGVESIIMDVAPNGIEASVAGSVIGKRNIDNFATRDGFANAAEMHAFWMAEHGVGIFRGTITFWEPRA